MAVFKPYLGITQYNSKTVDFTINNIGEALTRFSADQAGENFDSTLNQILIEKDDYVIKEDSDYIVFSFSLSRSPGDGTFSQAYVSLSVSGLTLDSNNTTVTVTNTCDIYDLLIYGSDFLLQWDDSNTHAIGRVRVSKEKLKTISRITHVFIAVADSTHVNSKELDASNSTKVVGKYFALNETHNSNVPKPQLSILDEGFPINNNDNKITLDALYQITEQNEELYIESIPMGRYHVAIAPMTISNEYAPIVYGMGSTNFKSDTYHGYTARYEFKTTSNMIIVSNKLQSIPSKNWDVSIPRDGQEEWKVEPITMLHGVYLYTFNFNNKILYKYTKFFEHTGNEQVFSKYFIFSGERYRTKFEKHEWSEDGETITLKRSYVKGTCRIKQGSGCPFSFNEVNYQSDGQEYILTLSKEGEVLSDKSNVLSSTFVKTINSATNLFFDSPAPDQNFYIPLQDEYKYYHMGHQLLLKKKNEELFSKNFAGQQEIVKYYDCDLSDNTTNTFLIDVSTIKNHSDGMNKKIDPIKCNIGYSSFKSSTPINDYFKSGEQLQQYYLEEQNEGEQINGAHFEYKNFVITDSNDVDLTNQVCIWNKNKGYVVFHCRDFSRLSQTNVFNTLKIQDGKLIYKINAAGIGDYNDDFTINQFINYCISGNHMIGLSNFGRDEVFQVYHGDDLILTLNGSDSKAPYTELLKLFYTDITNYLLFPIKNITEATIDLTIKYIKPNLFVLENNKDYTIFEITLTGIPIVSGSRPLAFRKNGIIVNPSDQNEILDEGTSVRINLKTVQETGKVIEIIACDESGNPIEDSDSCVIEYRREADSNGQVSGNFYFDGVNLKNLEETVGDSNNGLIKNVNSNTTAINKNTSDIAAIIDAIASQKILRGSGESEIYEIYGSGSQDGTGSFTISFADTIPENAIILETTYIETVTGYVEKGNLSSITATRQNANSVLISYSYSFNKNLHKPNPSVKVISKVIVIINPSVNI